MIENIKEVLNAYPLIAPFIFIILRTLPIIIPPIPGSVLDLLGVTFFGFEGFIWSVIGVNTGSMIAFYIGRYMREPLLKRFESFNKIKEWETKYSGYDDWWKLITIRFVSAPVFDVVNYAAGLSTISATKYFIATIISTTPLIVMFYYLGGKTLEFGFMPFIIFVSIFVIMLGVIPFKHKKV